MVYYVNGEWDQHMIYHVDSEWEAYAIPGGW